MTLKRVAGPDWGVLRVLGRALETLQEGLGCENDRMRSAVVRT